MSFRRSRAVAKADLLASARGHRVSLSLQCALPYSGRSVGRLQCRECWAARTGTASPAGKFPLVPPQRFFDGFRHRL